MKKFLKYINSMPFAFTMKHYQVFGDSTSHMKDRQLVSVESWDALRQNHPFFSVSADREEWLAASELSVKKDGQDAQLIERAADIVILLQDKKISRIFSVGTGGAALEYQIKKLMPGVSIVCSDYSTLTVERLKKVFFESDGIIQFDVLKDNWREIQEKYLGEDGLCLMYRIDASFNDKEWSDIFKYMADAGIQKILIIPTGTLTVLSIYNRKSREIRWFLKRIPIVFSGYIRTAKRFQQYWHSMYSEEDMVLGGLKSFFLTNTQV